MNNPTYRGYQTTIGIETHVQLKTRSKLFCGCGNDAREAEPNTLLCPVCLGMPGTLPILNGRAVQLAIRAGLALNAELATDTKFDRKNYFYPDLPKGYQITQFDQPIVGSGVIEVPMGGETFNVRISRAHMEEDAGKLIHPEGKDYSLVDLNRAGTPLLEIVSEPDIHSPEQAKAYAQELYLRMRYAEVSDANLYYGNMRFDVNVSVSKAGSDVLGTRAEIKNLNSFRSVERAAEYEINRQIDVLEDGGRIIQETRGYNDATGKTFSQRSKEEAEDYRYFPEPDLPPLVISEDMVEAAKAELPPLPADIRKSFKDNGLVAEQVDTLLSQPMLAKLQMAAIEAGDKKVARRVAGWLSTDVQRALSDEKMDEDSLKLTPTQLTALARMVGEDKLSSTAAKKVLITMLTSDKMPEVIAEEQNLLQVSDTDELESIVEAVIAENEQAANDVRGGEMKAIGFLVGQVMKRSQGKANPQMVQQLLRDKLSS